MTPNVRSNYYTEYREAANRVEDLLAVVAVRRFPVFGIGRLFELHFLAVGQPERRPRQVRVRENLAGRVRRLLRQAEGGDDALALAVERMGGRAQDPVERVAVDRQRFLPRVEALEPGFAQAQDLGLHE